MDIIKILRQGKKITQFNIGKIDKDMTSENIKIAVSKIMGVNPLILSMATRKREYSDARHLYCYIVNRETNMSLSAIGRTINRDHATVIYAVKKIRELKKNYKDIRDKLNEIYTII